MSGERRVRTLTFNEERKLAAWLEQIAIDSVISSDTLLELTARAAHMLGKDSSEVAQNSVQRIAGEIGVTLRYGERSTIAQRLDTLEMGEKMLLNALDALRDRVTELEQAVTAPRNDRVPNLAVTQRNYK